MSAAHALQTGMVDNAANSAKTVAEIILFMGRGISLLTNIRKKIRKTAYWRSEGQKARPMIGEAVCIERKRKRQEGNARHRVCRRTYRRAARSSATDGRGTSG